MNLPKQSRGAVRSFADWRRDATAHGLRGIGPLGGGGGGGSSRNVCVWPGGMCCSSGMAGTRCVCHPGETASWTSTRCGPNNQYRKCRCSSGGGGGK